MAIADLKLIESLQKEIEEITGDISDLMWDRKMYTEFAEMINGNPKINKPNAFYDFIKTGYVSHIVLGICRQTDKDEKALSLMNLMSRIFNDAEKVTKEWFAVQYNKSPVLTEETGRTHFKEHFGELDFIDPAIVHADIGKLIFYTKEIKKYRNKRIAHVDKGGVTFDKDFSFATLDKAIEMIEELGTRYYLLLRQTDLIGLLPVDQTDYKKVFCEPWLTTTH